MSQPQNENMMNSLREKLVGINTYISKYPSVTRLLLRRSNPELAAKISTLETEAVHIRQQINLLTELPSKKIKHSFSEIFPRRTGKPKISELYFGSSPKPRSTRRKSSAY